VLTCRQPDDIVAYRSDGPVRIERFVAEVRSLAEQLPDTKYIINLHTDRYLYLRSFCASLVTGGCTLMPPNRQAHTLEMLRSQYHSVGTVGDKGEEPVSVVTGPDIPDIPDSQHSAIAFTSGSTGSPSPNLKYWRTLRTDSLSNARLVLEDSDVLTNVVATVPPQHMWGMETSVLLPLFARVAVSHRSPFYPQDIADALAAIPEPRLLVSSPIHLETLLKSRVKSAPIAKIITATAPLSAQLAIDLETAFETRVQDFFGCSESGILATRHSAFDPVWTYADIFKLTTTVDGVLISGEHLSVDVLLPDIVELLDQNRFRWVGRAQDMINIAGKRGSLADLNFHLREIDGVDDGIIFERGDRPNRLAALVVAPGIAPSVILESLRSRVDPVFLPRPLLLVERLPRQETGKLAIKAVHELFAQIQAVGR
jgi:acyl-coenzyme A synthetase/AMP-(fatty) acid ligase